MKIKILSLFLILSSLVLLSSCVSVRNKQDSSEQQSQTVTEKVPEKSYVIIDKKLIKSDNNKKLYVYIVGTKVVAEETVDRKGNVVRLKGEIPAGTVRLYNLNDEVISEKYYDSPRREAENKTYEDRTYFEDGGISSIKTYTDGVLNGLSVEYYADGNKKTEANYKDGQLNGDYTKYRETGKIEYSSQYQDGLLNGEYKEYFETGTIKKEEEYLNDKKEGECKEYFETGILKHKYNYSQDILEGQSEIYYEDGSIKRKEIYKNGKLHGDVKIYSNNNSQYPMYIDTYYNGRKAARRAYSNKGAMIFKETY